MIAIAEQLGVTEISFPKGIIADELTVTRIILENRGIAYVGAQTKSIVKAQFNPGDL
jgi:hypothetical protein